METCVYTIIKIAILIHVLHEMWSVIFRKRMFGIWDCIFERLKKTEDTQKSVMTEVPEEIMGKPHPVYLKEPDVYEEPVPVMSEPLPVVLPEEEEEDFWPDGEIEYDLARELEDEIINIGCEPIDDENTGWTFQDLSNTVEVLAKDTSDEEKMAAAARTLYSMQNTELYDLLTTQVANTEMVESLFKKYLDADGNPIGTVDNKVHSEFETFDWDKFV